MAVPKGKVSKARTYENEAPTDLPKPEEIKDVQTGS